MTEGFIEDFTDFVRKDMLTNKDWVETCACSLVATAAGPERYISTGIGKLRLNIAGIHIGGSGIAIKSPFFIYILRPTLRHFSALMHYDYELATKFTIEYMTKRLCSRDPDTKQPLNQGLIVSDEYTLTFKEAKTKDYLTGTMEYLSYLLDGYVPKTGTIKRGEEFVPFCYVNFLSCTTPYFGKLLSLSGDDFFMQGTGARPLWHVETYRELISVEDLGEWFYDDTRPKIREKKLKEFAEKLHFINQECPYTAIPVPAASELLKQYRVDTMNQGIDAYDKNIPSPDVGVWAKVATNADKLAALHALGRYVNDSSLPQDHIRIERYDAEWSIAKAGRCLDSYFELKKIKEMFEKEKEKPTARKSKWRVIEVIEKCGGSATTSELLTKTGWLTKDLSDILQTLSLEGRIRSEPYGKRGWRWLIAK